MKMEAWRTEQLEPCPACGEEMPEPPHLDLLSHRCPPSHPWLTSLTFVGPVSKWSAFVAEMKRQLDET